MPTILIVDDNIDICEPLARLLGHLGQRAPCIENGELALAYLRTHIPKLVILDVMMPGLDGFAVLERIRQEPATARLPVVMFSAMADPENIARALALGANEYWVKGTMDFARLRDLVEPYTQALPADG